MAEKDPIAGWNPLEHKDFGLIKVQRLEKLAKCIDKSAQLNYFFVFDILKLIIFLGNIPFLSWETVWSLFKPLS